ncbi:MAG TPA: tetratricopeptide repeat protein [Bacteroidetes bacterium]|nr:tetratricopeptide repeat protein [Bacteroidota bacterium]
MKPRLGILLIFLVIHGSIISAQDINDYLSKAAALKDRSMFPQAIALYTEAIALQEDYRLFTERGDAYIMQGETEAAISDFMMANKLKPGSGYLGLARAYAINNDGEKAITNLQQHLKSEFKLDRKEILLDSYFSSLEETAEWRQLWKAKWYNSLEETTAEIEYLIETGKISEARDALSGIESLYGDRPAIAYLKGLIEGAAGNTMKALQYLNKAVALDNTEFKVWKLYIKQLEENGDYLVAANACEKAAVLYPGKTELILLKSENLRKAGDRDRALEVAEIYRELYPGDETANRQAGTIAAEKGEYNRALRYFSENIENYPGKAQCYTDRAAVYLKMKSWEPAVYDYSMALDLWPRDGEAYYNKGLALLNLGKTEEACHDFRLALRYGNRQASGMLSRYCIR